MKFLTELFDAQPRFKPGQYVHRVVNNRRLVYRIDDVNNRGYVVSIPHFQEGKFVGWSRPQLVPFTFLRQATPMPTSLAQRFHDLKPETGQEIGYE